MTDGANAQGTGGDEQGPDNGRQQNPGGQEGNNTNPTQNDQTGNQTNGQQNAKTGEGQQQNQPGQQQNQPNQPGQGTQNNDRKNPSGRRQKIDGESNPTDVFQETLGHIRETGKHDDGQDRGADNQQLQKDDRVQEGGPVPDQTPEHDGSRTTDRTDAYRKMNGDDPNAEQIDPDSDKPIYENPDNDNTNAAEAEGPGRSMTDDPSQGDSQQRGNTRQDESDDSPNTRPQSDNSEQNGTQENQPANDRGGNQQTTQEDGQPNAPSDNGTPSQQPQQPGNENTTSDGNGEMSGRGGGGQPQNLGHGTPTNSTPESKPEAANLEYTRQATDLAIRYLEDELAKERPDPRLLERLGGWNEHDLRRFVERWKEMQQQADQNPGTREGRQLDETLRNIGNLAPKATINQQRNISQQQRTTTSESQRYAPPGKYTERMNAYTQGINK